MISTITFSSFENMTQKQAELNCRVIDWFINLNEETPKMSQISIESTFKEFYY